MCRTHTTLYPDGCPSRRDDACAAVLVAPNNDPTVFQMMKCTNKGAEVTIRTTAPYPWHTEEATKKAERQEKKLANDEKMKNGRVLGTGEEVTKKD